MSFLLNIGNTHTQISMSEAGRLVGGVRSVTTLSLQTLPLPEPIAVAMASGCLVASVVPAATRLLAQESERLGGHLLFLHSAMVEGIDFSLTDVSTLGADRLANVVAAVVSGCVPVIVLDCGTCVTTEVVDSSKRFRGGAILPGRELLRSTLNEYTGLLPFVPLAEDCPSAIGESTHGAIRAGIDVGILGSVARLLEDTRVILGVDQCRTVVVGGDAAFFCRHMEGLTAGGEAFTLGGLATVAMRLLRDV